MKSTKHGFSSKRMPKGPHKTKKRLAAKAAMLTAKANKVKGKKKMFRPSRVRN